MRPTNCVFACSDNATSASKRLFYVSQLLELAFYFCCQIFEMISGDAHIPIIAIARVVHCELILRAQFASKRHFFLQNCEKTNIRANHNGSDCCAGKFAILKFTSRQLENLNGSDCCAMRKRSSSRALKTIAVNFIFSKTICEETRYSRKIFKNENMQHRTHV